MKIKEIRTIGPSKEEDDFIPFPSRPKYVHPVNLQKAEPLTNNFRVVVIPTTGLQKVALIIDNENIEAGYVLFFATYDNIRISNVFLEPKYRGQNLAALTYKYLMNKYELPLRSDDRQTGEGQKLWVKLSQDPEISIYGIFTISNNLLNKFPDYKARLKKMKARFWKKNTNDQSIFLFPVKPNNLMKKLNSLSKNGYQVYTRGYKDYSIELIAFPKGKSL